MAETCVCPDPRLADLEDLVEGLNGALRAGRERLLVELLERGYSAAALREAHDQDRLAVLLLEEALHESVTLTAREVASLCDLDLADVLRASRLLGLTVGDPDEPAFDEQSCDAMRMLHLASISGMSQTAVDALLTVLRRHMWQLTADMEVIVGNALGRPGDTEYELAHRYADAARVLAPTAAPLVAGAFTAHLRERMRDIFVTPGEAEFGALRAVADVAVAFVDLVGFTGLSERVDAGDLKSMAMRLADLADDTIEIPVRLVKTVGDAILLMSRDADALLRAVIDIHDVARRDPTLPRIHSGVAHGPAHLGGADVYGVPVNVASRLTDIAAGGTILATEAVVAAATEPFQWTMHGTHELKGCTEPLTILELASPSTPR
jgi:adenylate cyclase